MNRSQPKDLQKALDDARMALRVADLERQVADQAAVIAYQKRELDESRGKCADYDRMKQELENAKNELVEAKTMHDKDKAQIAALNGRLRAKAASPKRLLKAIRFEAKKPKTEEGTLVECGVPLPAKVFRSVSLHYGWHYGVYADETCVGDFTIGAAPTVAQSLGSVGFASTFTSTSAGPSRFQPSTVEPRRISKTSHASRNRHFKLFIASVFPNGPPLSVLV